MKLNKRFEKQRNKWGDTLFFLIIIILGLISSWLIYSLLKNYFNASFGSGIEIDPFAGMSTIIIGVFSLVILKRQTKIIERQTEISDIQNKITQNQLEIESKCELIVTNKDENIHCANSGNSPIENLIVYKRGIEDTSFEEVIKINYMPIGVELNNLFSVDKTSSLVFLYQNGYTNKTHVIIKHYAYILRRPKLRLMPSYVNNPISSEKEIEIYKKVNESKGINEAISYLLSLSG